MSQKGAAEFVFRGRREQKAESRHGSAPFFSLLAGCLAKFPLVKSAHRAAFLQSSYGVALVGLRKLDPAPGAK